MAKLFESYNSGGDAYYGLSASVWRGQTFKPIIGHRISSIKVFIRDSTAGNITASIRATSGGLPVGADLCSATIVGDGLNVGAWEEFVFSAPANLSGNTTYAICLRTVSVPQNSSWQLDSTSPTYSKGNYLESFDSGSSWVADTGLDGMFEEYGESLGYLWIETLGLHYIDADGNERVAVGVDSIVTNESAVVVNEDKVIYN